MGFMEKIVRQCRKPTGWFGRMVAKGMNRGHYQLTTWALEHIDINPKFNVLDIGCGGGGTVNRLAHLVPEGIVCGIDYSEDCVALSRKKNRKFVKTGQVKIQHGSVSNLPQIFSDGTFDLVTGIETLYFWPDIISDLRGVLGILKPGGRLLLGGEAYRGLEKFEERNQKWAELGNFPYFSIEEMRGFLEKAGFPRVDAFEQENNNWFAILGTR